MDNSYLSSDHFLWFVFLILFRFVSILFTYARAYWSTVQVATPLIIHNFTAT